MHKTLLLGFTALCGLSAQPALAQDTPPPEAAPESGTLSFFPADFEQSRPDTALDMVSRLPGFSISQNDSVRGFSGAVGNVLINGARPASKTESLSNILSRIPAAQVERIDLIRGGAAGVDMQGYSTVINVIRTGEASRRTVISLGTTVFDDGRQIPSVGFEVSGGEQGREYEFALNTSTSISDTVGTGAVRRIDPAGALLFQRHVESEADGDGVSVRGRWLRPALGGEIELSGNAGFWDFKFEQNEVGPSDARAVVDSVDTTFAEAGVRYARPLGPRIRLETRFIQQIDRREGGQTYADATTGQAFSHDNLSGESIARAAVTYQPDEAMTWEYGLEGAFNFLDASQALQVNGAPVSLPSDSVRVEELRAEAFAAMTWRLHPDLTLEAGLRIETSNISQSGGSSYEQTFVFAKPRLALAWAPTEHDQFRLRVERTVGQLDFGDFAASAELSANLVFAGNAELRPQTSWLFLAAWERRFWRDGVLTATFTHEALQDVADIVPVTDGVQVFSAPGAIGDGSLTRLEVDAVIPTDRLGVEGGRLWLRGRWRESEVTDPTTHESREISGLRNFEFNASFTHDIASWNTTWGAEWQPRGEDVVWRIDHVSRWAFEDYASAWIEYKPTPAWSLRAQAWMIGSTEQVRTVFTGPRDTGAPAYTEVRSMRPESRFSLRVRRTF